MKSKKVEYEFKTFQIYGSYQRCITDEHLDFIEKGKWEIVYFHGENKNLYYKKSNTKS